MGIVNEAKTSLTAAALTAVLIAGAMLGLRRFSPSSYNSVLAYTSRMLAPSPVRPSAAQEIEIRYSYGPDSYGGSQSNFLELPTNSQSNVLELPKASLDLVGVWGGYTHSAVYSLVPGALIAKGPDRISVAFGRQGDGVFVASELYTAPNQEIVGRPRTWMANPKEAFIKYEARDPDLDYVYLHRFKLLNSGKIAYAEKVDIYDRRAHSRVGRATQHALLEQLTTPDQRRKFARPSRFEISRGEVATGRRFAFSGSR
jgi:hypothetical protein